MGGHGLDSVARDMPLVAGSLEHDNEPSSFIKCGEFLELRKCLFHKKDCAP